jgi:hypothetical protein
MTCAHAVDLVVEQRLGAMAGLACWLDAFGFASGSQVQLLEMHGVSLLGQTGLFPVAADVTPGCCFK